MILDLGLRLALRMTQRHGPEVVVDPNISCPLLTKLRLGPFQPILQPGTSLVLALAAVVDGPQS